MTEEQAEATAITALGWIAADEDILGRFMALTGIATDDLRRAASEPGFLSGVLDFLAGHEPDLIAFAGEQGIAPEHVMQARHTLAPDHAGYD